MFEQVRVEKVDQTIPGPSGNISGAIEVMELHMDGTREGKIFAPGYGEFSTGTPGGDLEAVSLASPNDRRQGPAPAEFGALSGAAAGVFDAVAAADAERAKQAGDGARSGVGRGAYQGNSAADEVPDECRYRRARRRPGRGRLASRGVGRAAHRPERARSAAAVPTGDRCRPGPYGVVGTPASGRCQSRRFRCWYWPMWRRWNGSGSAPDPACRTPGAVDAAIQKLSQAADAEDLPAVDEAAAALNQAVGGLRVR